MREFLTTGFFGAILGLCIGTSASASIISRGFLDEALENYATNTALDLKANQSDFTDLSNIVGTPAELTYRDIMGSGDGGIAELMGSTYYYSYGDNTVPTNNISELINLNYTDIDFPGLAGVVHSLLWPREGDDNWPARLADIFHDYELLVDRGYWSFYELIMDGGQLIRPGITVYGLKDLTTKVDANTTKIGTLPEGITVQGMLDGWTDSESNTYLGVKGLNDKIGTVPDGKNLAGMISETDAKIGTLPSGDMSGLRQMSQGFLFGSEVAMLPSSLEELIKMLFDFDETTPAFEKIITGFFPNSETPSIMGLYPLTNEVKKIGTLPSGLTVQGMYEGWTDSESNTYLGVKGLNDKIGILPTTIAFFEYDANGTLGSKKYPTAEVFGTKDNIGGMLATILQGFDVGSGRRFLSLPEISTRTVRLSDQIGTLPEGITVQGMYEGWTDSESNTYLGVKGLNDKIGTLPSGEAPMLSLPLEGFNSHHPFPVDATYPQSLEELIIDLYGDTSAKHPGILGLLIDESINLVWEHEYAINGGNNHTGLVERTGAIERRIGTLPDEYSTVGAALTAMDAKIDARELPSTSDDGQYVLSAKKVGDTITYTWVRMDLTSEEQAQ